MSVIALLLQPLLLTFLDCAAPSGRRRLASALVDTPFAVSLTACGGASRCASASRRLAGRNAADGSRPAAAHHA